MSIASRLSLHPPADRRARNVYNPRRPMLLFREQDVERKTLERHGGPEGFLN